jgi:arylsulfatase A-like enzyme
VHESFDCTNYWGFQSDAPPSNCRSATESSLECVGNLTTKIPGDDTEYILDTFERFLNKTTAAKKPFLAHLWLHTVHEPHPALPEFFYAYNDTYGNPAGDYLGTLTQMDVQIGRLRKMLSTYGVKENTMIWFTADNGPHPGTDLSERDVRSSTNGMRQCKASLYEGGIRVPGILEWPAMVKQHRDSWVPVSTNDLLPTILELIGVPHPNPSWAADGISLVPLLKDPTWQRPDTAFLGFSLGQQTAIIENDWKLVAKPESGQCEMENNPGIVGVAGPFLYNLTADPTESHPLNLAFPDVHQRLSATMASFLASIANSQVNETNCDAS